MTREGSLVIPAAAALLAFQLGLMGYEQLAFGWPFAREEVPLHDAWHWLRRCANALLCFALVLALARPGLTAEPLSRGTRRAALAIAGLSLMATALLLASPSRYALVGAEDGAIEGATAALLLGAAAGMVIRLMTLWRASRATRWRTLHLCGTIGFALLFLVMAGEEVSWFQRQVGFATPEPLAARNWQGEFNLHNLHTDLTELVLYTATTVFLVLLPLVRESVVARWPLVRPFAALLPDRGVAALSMPMLVFTYSHFTLLPVQAGLWIALAACIAFARTAADAAERRLWIVMGLWLMAGQFTILVRGHTMLAIYDSSEYRELFLAIGLAAYGWRQARAPA